jgi:hypothetical protein
MGDARRRHEVMVRLNDDELARLDELRPSATARAVYLRNLLREPPTTADDNRRSGRPRLAICRTGTARSPLSVERYRPRRSRAVFDHLAGEPMTSGIRKRGGSYEASVYLKREGRKLRRTFPTQAAAKAWRAEAMTAANKGALRSPKPTTLRDAWTAWLEGAKAGTVLNRSGNPFKPSALRSYEGAMRNRVVGDLGGAKLADIQRADLQPSSADFMRAASLRPRSR